MEKSALILSVLALSLAASSAFASADVSININGFAPAPPGVRVYVEGGQGGRPYYREHGRMVYLERDERHGRRGRGHAYGHREHRGEHRGEGEHGGRGHHGKHD